MSRNLIVAVLATLFASSAAWAQSANQAAIVGTVTDRSGALVPGAESGNPKRGAVESKGFTIGFNGARAQYNSYNVDGAASTAAEQSQLMSSPALDAVKEFRVETNMYSAQYGRSGGAVVNIV